MKILKGLEAAVEVVKGILKQYDSDSYRYMLQLLLQAAIVLLYTSSFRIFWDSRRFFQLTWFLFSQFELLKTEAEFMTIQFC